MDISSWSVQYASATASTWTPTPLCPPNTSCMVQPGHYYLIQESQGTGGTTNLPPPDATGTIAMSGSAAKVALVASTTALSGVCPTGGLIVDFVTYGGTACTPFTAALSNTTAAVRKGNGCIDTGNNAADFVVVGPIPRNSTAPANSCGGDPSQPSGLGLASPGSLEPASHTLLTVRVSPATAPSSTGIAVSADLTSIGGVSSQQFYDDGTHGDQIAGDNVFSFEALVGTTIPTGVKYIVATVTDAQARTALVPITLTIESPTCGVERWSIKTGTDPDASLVNLNSSIPGNIVDLGALPAPSLNPNPPYDPRFQPTETTAFTLNATLTFYKKETDVDYHLVLQDPSGHTLIGEIPSPACVGASSPFAAGIAGARASLDSHLEATPIFQNANLPVYVKGVGFFDFLHGQTGVAPNGIELHPLLQINFTKPTSSTLISSLNPSKFGQAVALTGTVSNGGTPSPTGHLTLLDGASTIGTATLDPSGMATFNMSNLTTGSHSLTAAYDGDSTSAPSTSALLTQVINKADQAITFAPLPDKTYGDAPFTVSASGGASSQTVQFSASGACSVTGNSVTITGAGSCTITASQAGDDNYNPATSVARSFTINKAGQITVTVSAPADATFGQAGVIATAAGGSGTGAYSFDAGTSTACTVDATSGAIVITAGTGTCSITASRAGDANYNASAPSAAATINVHKAATAGSATSSKNPSTFGDSLTFTAQVSPAAATGAVQFKIDGNNFGAPVALANGSATSGATSLLIAGNHSVTAVYGGDNNFAGSTAAVTQVKNPAATSSAVVSSLSPAIFGQLVTFTATVTSAGGTPTGTVTFKDGTASLGTGTLNASGQAVFGTAALLAGNHSITAVYGGDNNFTLSTSAPIGETVIQANTTTTLTSSQNPSSSGQSVTFTATTLAVVPGAGIPTGAVTFKDGTTILATMTLNGSGQATFTTTTLALGVHPITATYSGDANFTSSGPASLSQVVFAYLEGGGSFVIGNLSAVVGSQVTFWDSQWDKSNRLSGGPAPSSFNGFASAASANPPIPGGTWTGVPGNSSGLPGSVPSYMAVLASSSITKTDSTIAGNIAFIVVVKTDPGYDSNSGHSGTGTVVAIITP